MKKIKLIGLTGQSGAGKSTVSAVFKSCGFFVIDADCIVRELYEKSAACLYAAAAAFGSDIVLPDKSLDRKKLARRAFKDRKSTELLNSIVHPFVTHELALRLKKAADDGRCAAVYDAPQLFESGADVFCDIIVAVTAAREKRIERICMRDGIDRNAALQRLSAQLDEDFFTKRCDIVIENNGSVKQAEKAAEKAAKAVISLT